MGNMSSTRTRATSSSNSKNTSSLPSVKNLSAADSITSIAFRISSVKCESDLLRESPVVETDGAFVVDVFVVESLVVILGSSASGV